MWLIRTISDRYYETSSPVVCASDPWINPFWPCLIFKVNLMTIIEYFYLFLSSYVFWYVIMGEFIRKSLWVIIFSTHPNWAFNWVDIWTDGPWSVTFVEIFSSKISMQVFHHQQTKSRILVWSLILINIGKITIFYKKNWILIIKIFKSIIKIFSHALKILILVLLLAKKYSNPTKTNNKRCHFGNSGVG